MIKNVLKKFVVALLSLILLLTCYSYGIEESAKSNIQLGGRNNEKAMLNEFYTEFAYSPLNGLSFDPNITRRDNSDIVKVGDSALAGQSAGDFFDFFQRNIIG